MPLVGNRFDGFSPPIFLQSICYHTMMLGRQLALLSVPKMDLAGPSRHVRMLATTSSPSRARPVAISVSPLLSSASFSPIPHRTDPLPTSLSPSRPLSSSRHRLPRLSLSTPPISQKRSFSERFDTSTTSDLPSPISSTRLPLSNIIDSSEDSGLSIESVTERGIQLSDQRTFTGGVVVVEGEAFEWNVQAPTVKKGLSIEALWQGWTEDNFKLLEVVAPRPGMLLFGTGQRVLPLPQRLKDYISKLGIQLDVMDTRNAASTFNLLQEEGRKVAAALCPISTSPTP